jgi:hypothetical protein
MESERDPRVRQLLEDSDTIFAGTFQRYQWAAQTEATAWWYIFWVSAFFIKKFLSWS